MKIMLRENIESLGKKGEILNVAAGYGRNYLIPKRLAVEVTPTNIKMVEIEQKSLQKGLEKEMASYKALAEKLNQVSLSFVRKTGEKDVLFGSVSSTDIKEALEEKGFDIEKKRILLDEPIKRLGNYSVPIKVFHEERAEIKVAVISEGEKEEEEEKEAGVAAVDEQDKEAEEKPEKEAAPEVETEAESSVEEKEKVEENKDEEKKDTQEEESPS